MTWNWHAKALVGAIVLQLLVLGGGLLGALYPRWLGQEVRLLVEPVDPRSLFRGNYAQLRYRIGEVAMDEATLPLRHGERVYVPLRPADEGVMQGDGLRLSPPADGLFIRGRVEGRPWPAQEGFRVRVRYGIEAYFLPRDKALAMEKALRQGDSVASVMVAPNGKAALVAVNPGTAAR